MTKQTTKEYLQNWLSENYSGIWFIDHLRKKLTDDQIRHVLETFDDTCKECYGPYPCWCWNDE